MLLLAPISGVCVYLVVLCCSCTPRMHSPLIRTCSPSPGGLLILLQLRGTPHTPGPCGGSVPDSPECPPPLPQSRLACPLQSCSRSLSNLGKVPWFCTCKNVPTPWQPAQLALACVLRDLFPVYHVILNQLWPNKSSRLSHHPVVCNGTFFKRSEFQRGTLFQTCPSLATLSQL